MPKYITRTAYLDYPRLQEAMGSESIVINNSLRNLFDEGFSLINATENILLYFKNATVVPSYLRLYERLEEFIEDCQIEFTPYQLENVKIIINYISKLINTNDVKFLQGGDNEIIIFHNNPFGNHNIIIDVHNIFFAFHQNNSLRYISKSLNEHFDSNLDKFLEFSMLYYAAYAFKM
jgi:hypothetical protein